MTRNGKVEEIDAKDLVPGDVVTVKVGDKVPADCRVIRLHTSTYDVAAASPRVVFPRSRLRVGRDKAKKKHPSTTSWM